MFFLDFNLNNRTGWICLLIYFSFILFAKGKSPLRVAINKICRIINHCGVRCIDNIVEKGTFKCSEANDTEN